jgi:hypothetical protein
LRKTTEPGPPKEANSWGAEEEKIKNVWRKSSFQRIIELQR